MRRPFLALCPCASLTTRPKASGQRRRRSAPGHALTPFLAGAPDLLSIPKARRGLTRESVAADDASVAGWPLEAFIWRCVCVERTHQSHQLHPFPHFTRSRTIYSERA
ncbi:hypothetical protein MRX96_007544 [Rhipicephalus microplus]